MACIHAAYHNLAAALRNNNKVLVQFCRLWKQRVFCLVRNEDIIVIETQLVVKECFTYLLHVYNHVRLNNFYRHELLATIGVDYCFDFDTVFRVRT